MRPEEFERSDESAMAQEGIIETATRLFASLGYDGTSVRMIADAAGLDTATVTALVGDKRDLYITVMERTHLAAKAAFNSALEGFTPDRAGLHRLVNVYLDLCLDRPEIPTLWIHRWLGDAADVAGLEALYLQPLLEQVCDNLRDIVSNGVDIALGWGTIVWCVRGFVVGGFPDTWNEPGKPHDSGCVQRFRTHLLTTADCMFLLIPC